MVFISIGYWFIVILVERESLFMNEGSKVRMGCSKKGNSNSSIL